MRIDLSENGARRYNNGATLLVVPVEPQPIFKGEYFEWIHDGRKLLVAGRVESMSILLKQYSCRPGDVLDVAEPFVRYQVVRRVKTGDGRSFSEVDDGQVAYQADGHESPADAAHHYRLIGGVDIEHVEVEDGDWRPASEMPSLAIRHHPVVVSVAAKRLGQLTLEERANAMGHGGEKPLDCFGEFEESWTADHREWQPEKCVWLYSVERTAT